MSIIFCKSCHSESDVVCCCFKHKFVSYCLCSHVFHERSKCFDVYRFEKCKQYSYTELSTNKELPCWKCNACGFNYNLKSQTPPSLFLVCLYAYLKSVDDFMFNELYTVLFIVTIVLGVYYNNTIALYCVLGLLCFGAFIGPIYYFKENMVRAFLSLQGAIIVPDSDSLIIVPW